MLHYSNAILTMDLIDSFGFFDLYLPIEWTNERKTQLMESWLEFSI